MIVLEYDSTEISHLVKRDKRLAKVISTIGPLSYELKSDGYMFLIHEIIEQMLSQKAAGKIFDRLQSLCSGSITPEVISNLSDEELKSIGTSSNKVNYIRCLTCAILDRSLSLDGLESLSDQDVIKKLTKIKGIGNWTAKMYLIFVLGRNNILPFEDVAFLQSYKWLYKTEDISHESIEKRTRKWEPYRSIAARYMYRALDSGLTKEEFHLYK